MKHVLTILFLGLILLGCQKEEIDSRDMYTGNWDFEVTYTSNVENDVRESVFKCQGNIAKDNNGNSLILRYCINDNLQIKVNSEGVVYSTTNELMGVIDQETCLIIDNNPIEESISKITIKGVK